MVSANSFVLVPNYTAVVPYIGGTIFCAVLISKKGVFDLTCWKMSLGHVNEIHGIKNALSIGFITAYTSSSSVLGIVNKNIVAATEYNGDTNTSNSYFIYYFHLVELIFFVMAFALTGSFGVLTGIGGTIGGVFLILKEYMAFIVGIVLGTISYYSTNEIVLLTSSFDYIYAAIIAGSCFLIMKANHIIFAENAMRFVPVVHHLGHIICVKTFFGFISSLLNLTPNRTRHFTLLCDTVGVSGIIAAAFVLGTTGAIGFALGDVFSTKYKHETYTSTVVICVSGAIGIATGIAGLNGTAGIIHISIGSISVTFLIYQFPIKRSIALLIKPNIMYHGSSAREMEQWLQKMGDIYDPVWSIDTGRYVQLFITFMILEVKFLSS